MYRSKYVRDYRTGTKLFSFTPSLVFYCISTRKSGKKIIWEQISVVLTSAGLRQRTAGVPQSKLKRSQEIVFCLQLGRQTLQAIDGRPQFLHENLPRRRTSRSFIINAQDHTQRSCQRQRKKSGHIHSRG